MDDDNSCFNKLLIEYYEKSVEFNELRQNINKIVDEWLDYVNCSGNLIISPDSSIVHLWLDDEVYMEDLDLFVRNTPLILNGINKKYTVNKDNIKILESVTYVFNLSKIKYRSL